jgi:antitoxin VapB
MKTAKLFKNGRSQAVRLPKEFQFQGDQVRIRRLGRGVLLEPFEPVEFDYEAWFAAMDAEYGNDFIAEGREQPLMPDEDISFD